LPRFINKATTVEPIQGGEENLLQEIKDEEKKNTEKPNLQRHQNITKWN
jgi:hypothetical protein